MPSPEGGSIESVNQKQYCVLGSTRKVVLFIKMGRQSFCVIFLRYFSVLFFCVLFFCVEGLLYSVGMYAVKLTAVLSGKMGWVFYCKCVAFTRPPK